MPDLLGTGFGCGNPGRDIPAEIGHIPVGFMPKALWQHCGCTTGHPTACAEIYASGRCISNCVRILLFLRDNPFLKNISSCLDLQDNFPDLSGLVADSKLRNHSRPNAKTVEVRECMEKFQLPGMRVLQFAFGDDFPGSAFFLTTMSETALCIPVPMTTTRSAAGLTMSSLHRQRHVCSVIWESIFLQKTSTAR